VWGSETLGAGASWISTASLPVATTGDGVTACGDYVYRIGGSIPSGAAAAVYFARVAPDGSLGDWKATAAYPQTTEFMPAVSYGGRIYVISGHHTGWYHSNVYYAKPNADGTISQWSAATAFPTGCNNHSAVAYDGYIYVLGGNNDNCNNPALDTMYAAAVRSDGSLGPWVAATSLPTDREQGALVVHDGRLYSIGGVHYTGSGYGCGYVSDDRVYFAPILGSGRLGGWTLARSLPQPINALAAQVTSDGRVYVVGGSRWGQEAAYNSVYVSNVNADGSLGPWSTDTSYPVAVHSGASALREDVLYVVGGDNAGGGLTTVRFADLRTGGANAGRAEDQDQDGLPDWKEALAGTKPDNPDSDGDGLTDGQELNGWSVAELEVLDESKRPGDPLRLVRLSSLVGELGPDGKWGGGSDVFPEDYNGDGKSDMRFGNSPGGFLERDADGDGDRDQADEAMITYLTPLIVKTNPLSKDTDGDGIPDASDPFPTGYVTKWEICVMGIENVVKHQGGVQWTCYPLPKLLSGWYGQGYRVDPAGTVFLDSNVGDPRLKPYLIYDGDGDGISLLAETCFNTLPELRRSPDMSFFTTIPDEKAFDSDDDGRSDLQEILAGTNPRGDIAMAKALLFVEATLLGGDASGAAVSVCLDIRDLRGLSEDGKNGWITMWVASSVGIGKELIPNLDAGFQRLPVKASLEEDPALPDGAAAVVLFLDSDLSIHFNPQLSFSITKELCHFDVQLGLLQELGLEALLTGMAGPVANLVRGARFLNWVSDNLGLIAAGKYPKGVRDAAVSGKSDRLIVETDCPVDLAVVDPDGLACSKTSSGITDATYQEGDFDGDGQTEDRVTVESRKIGDYRLAVSREAGATVGATYSLRVTSGAGTVEIAKGIPVPTGGSDSYRIRSRQEVVTRVAGGIPVGLLLLPVLGILAVAVSIAVVVRARRRRRSVQL
jgi:hypothetical protein